MIRLFNAYFPGRTVALGLSEMALSMLAFIAATVLHLGMLDATIALSYEQGYTKIALIVATFVICMYYWDMYDPSVLSNRREVFIRLTQSIGTLLIAFGCLSYLFPFMRLSLPVFMTGVFLVACGVVVCRALFVVVISTERFAEPCIIMGSAPVAQMLMAQFSEHPELGVRVVRHIREDEASGRLSSARFAEEIREAIQPRKVERVIVALGDRRGTLPVEELLRLKTQGIRIQDGVEVYERISGKIALESLQLSWLLFSPGFQVSRALLSYKRILAVMVSFVGLVLTLPLMALIAVAIRCDSSGPVIFRQRRIGKNGKPFTLYKFRSMRDGADRDGNFKPATANDPRFTRVGRWLRAVRLDELPQLFNIFWGDMNLVGPRPFVPNQEDECVRHIPFYTQRWTVKPGATGWAQVNRDYCATIADNAEKLAYDLFYIKNISIGLDLLIMFKTAKILLLGRGGR